MTFFFIFTPFRGNRGPYFAGLVWISLITHGVDVFDLGELSGFYCLRLPQLYTVAQLPPSGQSVGGSDVAPWAQLTAGRGQPFFWVWLAVSGVSGFPSTWPPGVQQESPSQCTPQRKVPRGRTEPPQASPRWTGNRLHLASMSFYWPEQVTRSGGIRGVGKETLPLMQRATNSLQRDMGPGWQSLEFYF